MEALHGHGREEGSGKGYLTSVQEKDSFTATVKMIGVEQTTPATPSATIYNPKYLPHTAMRRTTDWISSQEIACDIIIHAGRRRFSLHKFPLITKCGYIRRLYEKAEDEDIPVVEIPNIPGGSEVFELVVKFCHGTHLEISSENVAALRCAAEYLEMTDGYVVGNLISRTEAYLEEVALMNLSTAITVLHKAEDLLPLSEKVQLMSRCVDAIAYMACIDSSTSSLSSRADNFQESLSSSLMQPKVFVNWWAEELTVLRIDTFQRVLTAMQARGFRQFALAPVVMLYAQLSLRGLDIFGNGRKQADTKEEHEKRVVFETIVSLLPKERNAISVSFLSMLLRAAIFLEATISCRLDLERRMGLQLGQAVLDDLLIPSFSPEDDTMFDVNTIQRILLYYLEHETEANRNFLNTEHVVVSSSSPKDIENVGKLMESYLAEIASDIKLSIKKFMSIAELVPKQPRANEDGIYRAIDIYLKAHPSLTDTERKKLCSLLNCQKLSREACAHAAHNDRLPAQTVVQVLYYEQQRLRDVTSGGFAGTEFPAYFAKSISYKNAHRHLPGEIVHLQKENHDLKQELVRIKMQLSEVERPSLPRSSAEKPSLPKKSFINTISKKLGRLYPFFSQTDSAKSQSAKSRMQAPKDRRHSIS